MRSSGSSPNDSAGAAVGKAFDGDRRYLWGMLYRLTGCAADADDLLQETFVRALERPPADVGAPLRPWLVRVAVNLGKDHLRRRRRRGYVGPWLPSPIETQESLDAATPPSFEPLVEGVSTEGRYDLLESVSFAFLLALEALTPQQRAVLLLRDVFDYSVAETSEALAISEGNVKTTLHRARRAMQRYDTSRHSEHSELCKATRTALQQFLSALVARDLTALEALLAKGVTELSDSGGSFLSARNPIVGASNVARYFLGITPADTELFDLEPRVMNGLPAFAVVSRVDNPRLAPRFVFRVDVDAQGKIVAIHNILAPQKLTAVSFGGCA
jgi:RNA polymerase sigma-70 factor (ECF subfamily)